MLPKVMFNRWGASAPAKPPNRLTHWLTHTWLGAGARRVIISGGVIGGIGYLAQRQREQRTQLPSKLLLSLDLTTTQLVEKAPTPQAKLASLALSPSPKLGACSPNLNLTLTLRPNQAKLAAKLSDEAAQP